MEPEGSLPHSQEPVTCLIMSQTNPFEALTTNSDPFEYYPHTYAYVLKNKKRISNLTISVIYIKTL